MKYPAIEKKTRLRDEQYCAFRALLRLYNEAESWEEFCAERTVHGYDNVNKFLGIDTFHVYYLMISYGKKVKRLAFWMPFAVWMFYAIVLLVFGHNDNEPFSFMSKFGVFLLWALIGAFIGFIIYGIVDILIYVLTSKIDKGLHSGRYMM